MGAVELQPIEAGVGTAASRGDEVGEHPVHVVAGHGARRLAHPGEVGDRRRRPQRPVALGQGLIHLLPAELGRPLAPGVSELEGDLGVAPGVHRVDDAFPGGTLLVVPEPGAGGRDPRVGGSAGHLGDHHPGAAQRARPEMHQVKVVGDSVDRRVGRHRRHHDAVAQGHAAHPERREHRRASLWRTLPRTFWPARSPYQRSKLST